mmetsp:Transcript_8851/g.27208  ORF Transcript_8851/g.27208 Transcript_8851/m.27208 type:complete len:200 (-) Transcript_8851:1311-1910(-)
MIFVRGTFDDREKKQSGSSSFLGVFLLLLLGFLFLLLGRFVLGFSLGFSLGVLFLLGLLLGRRRFRLFFFCGVLLGTTDRRCLVVTSGRRNDGGFGRGAGQGRKGVLVGRGVEAVVLLFLVVLGFLVVLTGFVVLAVGARVGGRGEAVVAASLLLLLLFFLALVAEGRDGAAGLLGEVLFLGLEGVDGVGDALDGGGRF